MKQALLLLLAFSLLGTACTNLVFEQPQPVDADKVTAIPNEYHGQFVGNINSPDNFDTLLITANSIYFHEDTFQVGKNMELRKTKEYFWVNLQAGEPNRWAVILAYPAKTNMLEIKPLKLPENKVKPLAKLTELKQLDADNYIANPTKKELKKIMEEGIFTEKVILKRLK